MKYPVLAPNQQFVVAAAIYKVNETGLLVNTMMEEIVSETLEKAEGKFLKVMMEKHPGYKAGPIMSMTVSIKF